MYFRIEFESIILRFLLAMNNWESVKLRYFLSLEKGSKPVELSSTPNGNLPYLTMDNLRGRNNQVFSAKLKLFYNEGKMRVALKCLKFRQQLKYIFGYFKWQ